MAIYNPSKHTASNKPYGTRGKAIDARSYYYDDVTTFRYQVFTSKQQVLDYFPTTDDRRGHFPIIINTGGTLQSSGYIEGGTNVEWWWKDNYTDDGLIIKSADLTNYFTKTESDSRFLNINGIAANSLKWNNLSGSFITPRVGTIQYPIAIDVNGNAYKYTVEDFRNFLEIPDEGETLQSVTNRGNSTSFTIEAANAILDTELTTLGQTNNLLDGKLSLSGGEMTGDIQFNFDYVDKGVKWNKNSDYGYIYFESTSNTEGDSNLIFENGDDIEVGGETEGFIFRKSYTGSEIIKIDLAKINLSEFKYLDKDVQMQQSDELTTTSKEVVPAINEVDTYITTVNTNLQNQISNKADISSIAEIIKVSLASGVSSYTNTNYSNKTGFLIDITTGGAGAVFELNFNSLGEASLGFTTSQPFIGILSGTSMNLDSVKVSEMYPIIFTEYSEPVNSGFSITTQTNSIGSQPLVNINTLLKTSGKKSKEVEIRVASVANDIKILKVNLTTLISSEITTIPKASLVLNTVQKFTIPLTEFASDETMGVIGSFYYLNTTTYNGTLYGTNFVSSNPLWTFSYRPLIYTKESRFDKEIDIIETNVEINTSDINSLTEEFNGLLFDEYSTPVVSNFVINKTSSISSQVLVNINTALKTSNKQVNGIDIKFSAASNSSVVKVNLTTLTYTTILAIPSASINIGTIQHFDFDITSFASNETIGVVGACYYNNDASYPGVLYGSGFTSNPVWAFSYLPYIYTKESRFDNEIAEIEANVATNTTKINTIENSIYTTSEAEIVSNFQFSSMPNTYTGPVCNINPNLKGNGLTISKVNIKFSGNTLDGKIYKATVNENNTFTLGSLLLTIPKAGITINTLTQYTLPSPVTLSSNESLVIDGQLYYGGSGMLYPGAIYGTTYSTVFTFSYDLVVLTAINNLDNLSILDRISVVQDSSDMGAITYQPLINDGYNHIICYGQSLSKGAESYTPLSTTSLPNTFMIGSNVHALSGAFTPLKAAQQSGTGAPVNEMEPPIIGTINALKTRLDKTYLSAAKYVTSTPGVGGRTIELLSKECTNNVNNSTASNIYNLRFIPVLNAAKTNAGATKIVCPAIVYMQGEYNQTVRTGEGLTTGSNNTADKNAYKALLLTLKNNMQNDIINIYGQEQKPLFFIYLTSAKFVGVNDMPATYAQYEFAMENDDVILLNPHYALPTAHDGSGHLCANGSRWEGELIAKGLYNVLYKGKRFNPVIPMNYQVYKKSIYIDCYVPCAPLVFDVKTLAQRNNFGFNVSINNVVKPISSISIIAGTTIKIDLSEVISGTLSITYGGSIQNGYGNIRDSDKELAFANYIDDNSLSVNDIPPYTPVDNNNINYYGRRYPLWNWLANFKKDIIV